LAIFDNVGSVIVVAEVSTADLSGHLRQKHRLPFQTIKNHAYEVEDDRWVQGAGKGQLW
jgi:hypothetical protein